MSLSSTGNLGVGTTAPVYKLDVVGDINYTGQLRVNGSPATFGTILTQGYIAYGNGTGLTGENVLFWDETNNRLGVNTATPATTLDVSGTINTT